jgi:hypothetical protein
MKRGSLRKEIRPSALHKLPRGLDSNVQRGDIIEIRGSAYVTHSGLLRIAHAQKCAGISVSVIRNLSDPGTNKWVCRALAFKTAESRPFMAYGDADPSNVSPEFHGCELRIAETRAVNRALRKAYGIGLCSLEELGTPLPTPTNGAAQKQPRPAPLLEVVSQIPLRDQLRQLIRQHQLDPALVKQYALEHCGVKNLRQATREQVSSFVKLLGERVVTNHEALVTDLQRFVINNSKDDNNQKEAA